MGLDYVRLAFSPSGRDAEGREGCDVCLYSKTSKLILRQDGRYTSPFIPPDKGSGQVILKGEGVGALAGIKSIDCAGQEGSAKKQKLV
jgi:hypothetical protein